MQGVGCRMQSAGYRVQRVQGLAFGLVLRAQDLKGLGIRFWVLGSDSRVKN